MGSHLEATYFAAPAGFREWLAEHHATAPTLWVGFHKVGTGRPSLTWPQSVDEALCFGWIDGLRKGVDADRYAIRFSPRTPSSNWSKVNVARYEALLAAGRVRPAGVKAFAARSDARTGVYSFEREEPAALSEAESARFATNPAAWAWFQGQPPGYRHTALHWVVSARRPDTRARRLDTLIADAAAGLRIKELRR